jgi:serine/threonine-protein kinase
MAEPTGGKALAPPKGLREADRPRAAAEEGAGFRRFGRYEIQEPLPGSDVGELYRARDTDRNRTLALTILPTECSSDRDFVNHFRRVMPVVATLTAPGIVPVGYFGMFDRRLYVATRLIEAERLAVVLEREGALLPARAVRVVDQVAEALDALHAVGVVHGGIGPSAILLGPDDSVLVTDIGLAPPVNVTPAALGLGGRTAGTLAYMAPEWLTRRQVSPRADVYSLACLLVECLTGAPPYPVRDLPSLLYAHLYLAPTDLSRGRTGVPPPLDEVINRGMATRPENRFSAAGEFSASVRRALTAPAPGPLLPRPAVVGGSPVTSDDDLATPVQPTRPAPAEHA